MAVDTIHLRAVLERIGKGTVKGAQSNLDEGNHNRTGNLRKSLDYKAIISKQGQSFRFQFDMKYYGIFLDMGTRFMRPTYFLSNAFDAEFAKMDDEIVEAFALDVEDLLEHTLDDVFNDPKLKKYSKGYKKK